MAFLLLHPSVAWPASLPPLSLLAPLGVIDAQMTVHLGIFGSRAVVWTARKYAWKAHRKNGPKNHTYARKYGGVVRVANPEPP